MDNFLSNKGHKVLFHNDYAVESVADEFSPTSSFPDLPETGHLPLATESLCRLKRWPDRAQQERAGVRTGRSTETGRVGGSPLPRIRPQPGPGNGRDPCRTSEIGAPAPRSESPGRYEQEWTPPKSSIWIHYLLKGAWGDECVCVCVCVLVRMCVHMLMVRAGHVYISGGGHLIWVWGNNFSGGGEGKHAKPTFISLNCGSNVVGFFLCHLVDSMYSYSDHDEWATRRQPYVESLFSFF